MKSFRVVLMIGLALGAAAVSQAQDRGGYGPPDRRYGGYDRRGGGMAYQIGRQDGERDGREDALRGHSFRPTHSGNYRHADRGYHRDFGSRQWYRDTYRSGYMEGYRAGYSVRGRRW